MREDFFPSMTVVVAVAGKGASLFLPSGSCQAQQCRRAETSPKGMEKIEHCGEVVSN